MRVTDFGLARLAGRAARPGAAARGRRPQPLRLGDADRDAAGHPGVHGPGAVGRQVRGCARRTSSPSAWPCTRRLYGERPFSGETLEELRAAVHGGEVPPPPPRARVPARVRRVLLQGLRVAPGQRYPSMRQLLAVLGRDPLGAGRVALWAGAALVLLAVGVAIGGGRSVDGSALLCRDAGRKLSGIWDAPRKAQVREALLSAGTPYAEDAWRGVERALDGYAQGWVSLHTESCEATRVRGERSEALMDLQVTCLERRARDLKALTDLFIRGRSQAVESAVQAAYALAPLKECAETDTLAARVKRPKDPAQRARVEQVDHQLSEVRALVSSGANVPALEKAEAIAEAARELPHAPTRAEAYYQLGVLRMRNGEAQRAQDALTEAALSAEAGHHDRLAALARIDLVYVRGELSGHPDAAPLALREAWAALLRYGSDADMESTLESIHARLLISEDRCEEAVPHLTAALALADKAYAPTDPQRARLMETLSASLLCAGKFAEARERAREAVALQERALGPNHPEVAVSLSALAKVCFQVEDKEPALGYYRRALEIRERALGPRTVTVADSLMNVGATLAELKRYPESRDYLQRALDIYESVLGPDSPRLATLLGNLGDVEVDLHNPARGALVLERALKLLHDCEDVSKAIIRFNLAKALGGLQGEEKRAKALALEARGYLGRRKEARKREMAEIDTWLKDRGM